MIVLSDNDILFKLAHCDLFSEFVTYLKVPAKSIFILSTCMFKLRRLLKNDQKTLGRLEKFCLTISILEDDNVDMALLEALSETGADAGEALLAAKVAATPGAFLITGDKRAIIAFSKLPAGHAKASLYGRILCFEELLIGILQAYGFLNLQAKIIAGSPCDGVLRNAFGVGRNEAHAMECLQ